MNRMYTPSPYLDFLMSYGAGVIAYEKCEFDTAENHFRHCLKHNSENWRAKYLLAMTLVKRELFADARNMLIEIIDLCPNEDIRAEAIHQRRLIENSNKKKVCTFHKRLPLAIAN